MRAILTAIVLLAGGCWLIGKPWLVATSQARPSKATFLCSLKNSNIDESSGVAASYLRKGVFWTHNDSGGKAEVYAFDLEGKDLGTYSLVGVSARDWEDIASVKISGKPFLYVGDIGDNMKNQAAVRVYRFREPAGGDARELRDFDTYVLRFADGPHNCETLMVSPTGDIYLVTKDEFGDSSVHVVASPPKSGSYSLKKVSDLKLEAGNVYSHMITGGDISPDGKSVVIRTYFSILLYRPGRLEDFAVSQPVSLPVPVERQGEAVCFDVSGDRLITTSEGSPCRVSSVSLP